MLFAYEFAHRKSVDFVVLLAARGIPPAIVVGAPRVDVRSAVSAVAVGHREIAGLRAEEVCTAVGVPYLRLAHDDPEVPRLAARYACEIGLVGGARLLPSPVIQAFPRGILNLHPGLIPENRGLDNVQLAVYRDLPMAITTHLIDRRVDAGIVLDRYLVPVFAADALPDIGLRLVEAQGSLLAEALERAATTAARAPVPADAPPPNPVADPIVDAYVARSWPAYVARWAIDRDGWRCICRAPLPGSSCRACGRRYEAAGELRREIPPAG